MNDLSTNLIQKAGHKMSRKIVVCEILYWETEPNSVLYLCVDRNVPQFHRMHFPKNKQWRNNEKNPYLNKHAAHGSIACSRNRRVL